MNKTGYQLKKQKRPVKVNEAERPTLVLGQRMRRYEYKCMVCGAPMLAHRPDAAKCSVKCRVAWHRMTEAERAMLLESNTYAEEGEKAA